MGLPASPPIYAAGRRTERRARRGLIGRVRDSVYCSKSISVPVSRDLAGREREGDASEKGAAAPFRGHSSAVERQAGSLNVGSATLPGSTIFRKEAVANMIEQIRYCWINLKDRIRIWWLWYSPPWSSTRRCPGCAGSRQVLNSYDIRDCEVCQGAGTVPR